MSFFRTMFAVAAGCLIAFAVVGAVILYREHRQSVAQAAELQQMLKSMFPNAVPAELARP